MQKAFLIILLVVFFISCKENDGPTSCGVGNPVKELPWLNQEIKEIETSGLREYSYLVQATYKGETVFFMGSCCPFCKFALIVMDCQGNVLKGVSSDELKDQKVIWKPSGSVCKVD